MNYRIAMATAVTAALLVAGCGKSEQPDTGPKTMDEAKQEAQKLERPMPGQYKQVMTITKFEIPGAPPEAAEQFKQMMQKAQESSFCLTEKMADEGFKDMFDKVGENGDCSYDRFDVGGGKLDAVMKCQGKDQGTAVVTLNGKVTSSGSDVTVNVDQDNPNSPMGKAKIGMHMVSERIGECTGKE